MLMVKNSTCFNRGSMSKKRKKDRSGYKEFFERHVFIIKTNRESCRECGVRLKGNVREVCHILPKQYFKSIATDDDNIIYLCEEHHNEFDNSSNENVKKMKIYPLIQMSFKNLEGRIKEKLNYKHREKYE